ncbi:MAG: hypothetical protein ACTICQ_07635 [Glutamicibacter arilaitensis]|uniref:Uncharacterized protein n=1 Tax=Glutamicibacter arilaitensis TaxID=256701 RepID=A0A4Y8TZ88_9MICC|nr:hypothetical protein [Glutamicibacter arilaitensis]TFH57062.1 hypothetical protein EXY26_08710 [Glutamicibacter arilaitensis]
MLIRVEIYGGLHACCHEGFSVGDQVRWQLAQVRNSRGAITFELDDHGTFDCTGVPVAAVPALVARIQYRDRVRAGQAGSSGLADEVRVQDTVHVPAGTDFDHDWIIATLQVDARSLPPLADWDG